MTSDSLYQLRGAVMQRLTSDAGLVSLVSRIYDYLPENPAYPYVFIAASRATDWSSKSFRGIRAELRVNSYTRDKNTKKCLDITARVEELLHNANLTLTGHSLIDIRLTANEVEQLLDGVTCRGISRFSAFIEEG